MKKKIQKIFAVIFCLCLFFLFSLSSFGASTYDLEQVKELAVDNSIPFLFTGGQLKVDYVINIYYAIGKSYSEDTNYTDFSTLYINGEIIEPFNIYASGDPAGQTDFNYYDLYDYRGHGIFFTGREYIYCLQYKYTEYLKEGINNDFSTNGLLANTHNESNISFSFEAPLEHGCTPLAFDFDKKTVSYTAPLTYLSINNYEISIINFDEYLYNLNTRGYDMDFTGITAVIDGQRDGVGSEENKPFFVSYFDINYGAISESYSEILYNPYYLERENLPFDLTDGYNLGLISYRAPLNNSVIVGSGGIDSFEELDDIYLDNPESLWVESDDLLENVKNLIPNLVKLLVRGLPIYIYNGFVWILLNVPIIKTIFKPLIILLRLAKKYIGGYILPIIPVVGIFGTLICAYVIIKIIGRFIDD